MGELLQTPWQRILEGADSFFVPLYPKSVRKREYQPRQVKVHSARQRSPMRDTIFCPHLPLTQSMHTLPGDISATGYKCGQGGQAGADSFHVPPVDPDRNATKDTPPSNLTWYTRRLVRVSPLRK